MRKIYHGRRISEAGGQPAFVNNKPLKHIVKHSPTGFNWGYGGSGAADLALSILADCVGLETAEKYYQRFKWDYVAKWGDEWQITEEEIKEWLAKQSGLDEKIKRWYEEVKKLADEVAEDYKKFAEKCGEYVDEFDLNLMRSLVIHSALGAAFLANLLQQAEREKKSGGTENVSGRS